MTDQEVTVALDDSDIEMTNSPVDIASQEDTDIVMLSQTTEEDFNMASQTELTNYDTDIAMHTQPDYGNDIDMASQKESVNDTDDIVMYSQDYAY